MREIRERRSLTGLECLAVVACAAIAAVELVPVAIPLLAVATASRWARGRGWREVAGGGAYHAALGALAGAAALGLAIALTSRGIATLSQRSFTWTQPAMAGGTAAQVAIVAGYVAVTALALELALRGWIVERVLELSPGSPVMPVVVGALVEALVTPGDGATRTGAALLGAGLGWLYVAGGGAVASASARIVFQAGAVVLEALRVVA